MTRYKNMPAVIGHNHVYTRFIRFCKDGQPGIFIYIAPANFSVAGMRRQEFIIKPANQLVLGMKNAMMKDAKFLFAQGIFWDSIVMLETCLSAPANMKSGKDIFFCPFHDVLKFPPIIHFFKWQLLHGCARDDQPIELPASNLGK